MHCIANRRGDATMTDIHFVIEEAPEGGYIARAVGEDIFTEADDLPTLRAQLRDAVRCHFADAERPGLIHLHISREEVLQT
jgi:hypothetical protein